MLLQAYSYDMAKLLRVLFLLSQHKVVTLSVAWRRWQLCHAHALVLAADLAAVSASREVGRAVSMANEMREQRKKYRLSMWHFTRVALHFLDAALFTPYYFQKLHFF